MMFLQLSSMMDLATQHGPGVGGGCKGCEKHLPVLWRGLQTSFLTDRNAELVTRSAHQEGVASPSPSKWSWSIMQNKSLHYPHHSRVGAAPCCPVPLPWQQGDAGDCSGRVVLGTIKPSAEALSPSLSHGTDVWNVLRPFINDLLISSSWKCF